MAANNGYGTKMDDVIIESLKPQVEEIKQKLSSGGGLSQGDIITLTIYTQGNHINHLDMRMDSIDKRMDSIEDSFKKLVVDSAILRADFAELRADFEKFRADIYGKIGKLEVKIAEIQGNFTKMTAIISSVCAAAIAIASVIAKMLN